MYNERDDDIIALIDRLKAGVKVAQKHSLDHTILLLKIAVLDLQTILHSISEDELREFTEFVEEHAEAAKSIRLC